MKQSQCDRIIKYIEDYGSITTLQAFTDLGCTRLASRIHDLKRQGYNFKIEVINSRNRYGEPVRFNKYSIERKIKNEQI